MPIHLTTAFSPGDLDAGKSYTHVKIMHLEHDIAGASIRLIVRRGYTLSGAFVVGAVSPPEIHLIRDQGEDADYTDLVAHTVAGGDAGERVYDVIASHLYQHLIDKGIYVGEIE